ncbi:MAG: hypothetical protein U5K72_17670 [Balneolaceae bacterium]|nr:hypothetical protein [Balneolaceae bacterium]
MKLDLSRFLDHLFGLDNSKQNVFNFKNVLNDDAIDVLNDEDSPTAFKLMHELAKLINPNIKEMKKDIDEMKKGSRSKQEKETEDAGELEDEVRTD